MKNVLLWAALAAPLAAAAQQAPAAKNSPGYTIQGKVGTLNKPAIAYLTYKVNGTRMFDSTYLHNGAFMFKGRVGAPKEAHIRLKHTDKPHDPTTRQTFDILPFFLEDVAMKVVAKDSVNNAKITGSPVNDENVQLTAYLKPYYDKFEELNKEFKGKSETEQQDAAYRRTLESRATEAERNAVQAKLTYAKAHSGSYMSLVALYSTLGDNADAVASESIFEKFSPVAKASELGTAARERIQTLKHTQEGMTAPDFTLQDLAGKTVKLSDFRGKYVLLDFWASWCAPCRRENPNLVKSYEAYKDKGFTVLGVSLDKPTDKEKWQKAVTADRLTWPQVSDLKYWDSDVAKLYDVKAIPMNFLIDPNGRIVAKYLRGEALNKKLQEVLNK